MNEVPTTQRPGPSGHCESDRSHCQENTASHISCDAEGKSKCVVEQMTTSQQMSCDAAENLDTFRRKGDVAYRKPSSEMRTAKAMDFSSADVKDRDRCFAASQSSSPLKLDDKNMEEQYLLDTESWDTTQDLPELVRHAAELISQLYNIGIQGTMGETQNVTITYISGQLAKTLSAILQCKMYAEDTISRDRQSPDMEAELASFAEVMKSNTELYRVYINIKAELDALKRTVAQNAPSEPCSPTLLSPFMSAWSTVNERKQSIKMKQPRGENIGDYMDEDLGNPDTFTDEQALQLQQPHIDAASRYSSFENQVSPSKEDFSQDNDDNIRIPELEREIAQLRGLLDVERRANDSVQPTYKPGMADVQWNEKSLRIPSSCVSPRTVLAPGTLLTQLSAMSSPLCTSPMSVSHTYDARLERDRTFAVFAANQWQAWVVMYNFVWCLMKHGQYYATSADRNVSLQRIFLPDGGCREKKKKPLVPWDELFRVVTHLILFIAIQAWIACYREREIWFQANGLTRKYLLTQARVGPSWWPNFGLCLMPSPQMSIMLYIMMLSSGQVIALLGNFESKQLGLVNH